MNEGTLGQQDVRPDRPDSIPTETERLRKYWPGRTWRQSREGNWYLNADGFNLVVSDKGGGGWTVFVRNRETDLTQRGRKADQTLEAAKLAAFDALMWAKRNL